jgi:hypothetical protein
MKASSGSTATAALRRKLWWRLLWKVPLIVLLVAFAVWWESRKPQRDSAANVAAAAFTGAWSGEVSYGDGARFNERFFFQPEGGKLFGSAGFRGLARGIEEGSVDGNRIAFYLRYPEASADPDRDRKNYYWGEMIGQEIKIRMQDDRGNQPVEWLLRRNG